MALVGYIIGTTGILPTDPRLVELAGKPLLLRFTAWALQQAERRKLEALFKGLGVYWTWEDIMPEDDTQPDRSKLLLPLTLTLAQDPKQLWQVIRQHLRPPGHARPEQDLSKDDFLKLAQRALAEAMAADAPKR